jgi:ribose transport system substrate-binding protein
MQYHVPMLSRAGFVGGTLSFLLCGCRRTGKRRIAVIPKATSHLFFVSVRAGVNKAATDFDTDVLWNGPQEETNHARQIEIVDSMIAQQVDGLAISATDEHALAAPVSRAIQSGIPVVVFDSGVNAQGYISMIATDNYEAGCRAARILAGLIKGTGSVAMVMHKPGGTSTLLRERGFEETLKREFPNVAIVARQFGMADEARALAAAENILTTHPNLGGFFASSEASSIGAIQALSARRMTRKVRLITFDTSKTHIEALRNETIDVMLVQDAFRIGYESVRALAQKLTGGTPAPRIDLPAREVVTADLSKPEIQALLAGQG